MFGDIGILRRSVRRVRHRRGEGMKRVKVRDLRRMVALKRELNRCGWSDDTLKQEYFELLRRVHGGVVRGVHSGYEYVVLDVGFCDHPACEGVAFVSYVEEIMRWPHGTPKVSYVLLSNLEEV